MPADPAPEDGDGLFRFLDVSFSGSIFGLILVGPLAAGLVVEDDPLLALLLMVLLVVLVAVIGVLRIFRRWVVRARASAPAPVQVRVVRYVHAEDGPDEPVALLDETWANAQDRFTRLRADYGAFECDPLQVLRLPALADVAVASTGRFVDAFAEAQALHTDCFPDDEHARRFVAAVNRVEPAWQAARDAADRIRLSGLSSAEWAAVERVIKLLTTAGDSDSEPERLAAYTRARSELAKLDRAGVLHVPSPAQAALDLAARGQLPA